MATIFEPIGVLITWMENLRSWMSGDMQSLADRCFSFFECPTNTYQHLSLSTKCHDLHRTKLAFAGLITLSLAVIGNAIHYQLDKLIFMLL